MRPDHRAEPRHKVGCESHTVTLWRARTLVDQVQHSWFTSLREMLQAHPAVHEAGEHPSLTKVVTLNRCAWLAPCAGASTGKSRCSKCSCKSICQPASSCCDRALVHLWSDLTSASGIQTASQSRTTSTPTAGEQRVQPPWWHVTATHGTGGKRENHSMGKNRTVRPHWRDHH